MADQTQRFMAVKAAVKDLGDRKIRQEERFNTEKERFEKLLKEIADKGYDPKNLQEIRQTKAAELDAMLKELEDGVKKANDELSTIEAG